MSSKKQVEIVPETLSAREANTHLPNRKTKLSRLLGPISREEGATPEELTSATGWLPHTARAAITGLRKRGHEIQFKRIDGISRYFVGSSNR